MTEAGLLNHRICLLKPVVTTTDHGPVVSHFTEVGRVWARVEMLGGSERLKDRAILSMADVRITIRYTASVTDEYRIVHNGQTLSITSVSDPDGRRRELVILAKMYREAA